MSNFNKKLNAGKYYSFFLENQSFEVDKNKKNYFIKLKRVSNAFFSPK